MPCPVTAGAVEIPMDVTVASTIPSQLAVLEITLDVKDAMCAKINTKAGLASADQWESYKQQFGKVYNSGDAEAHAKANFEANDQIISETNAQGLSYTLGHNQFSDMNQEEFKATMLGYKKAAAFGGAPKLGEHVHDGSDLAASVDWVSKGAVTPIKDQGQCGSCWAFSTTGSTEGAYEIASGKLKSLSEQQLVDCSTQNNGCQGGSMELAFTYLEGAGSCTEASYPYKAVGGTCKVSSCSKALTSGQVSGYKTVGGFFGATEQDLMSAVQQNPVSVAIEADQASFQLYKSGVLTGTCGSQLDHGVLAVGYGTTGSTDYWKIKNSWGTSWGEAGYGLLLRGKGGQGQCGILGDASYPQVSAGSVNV